MLFNLFVGIINTCIAIWLIILFINVGAMAVPMYILLIALNVISAIVNFGVWHVKFKRVEKAVDKT